MKNETLYVLMQPEARNSYWADNIRDGIRDGAREWQDAICAIDFSGIVPDLDGKHVLVVGNNGGWLEAAVAQLVCRRAHPIIVNACMLPVRQYRCSGVVFELEEMLGHCLELLAAAGRRRCALLGVHSDSVTDHVKADAFMKAAADFRPEDIIWAPGRLDDCVEAFAADFESSGCDAAICANDTVAVSLIRHLTERGFVLPDSLYIIGMGNSYIGAGLRLPLTSVMFDYREMGATAVRLYHNLRQSRSACHMTVSLPCRLIVRDSAPLSDITLPPPMPPTVILPQRSYFDCDEVQNIIRVEAMLQAVDAIDREILFGLARNESCDAIAERLFFSGRAVRYRLTNLVRHWNFENRAALEEAVKRALQAGG